MSYQDFLSWDGPTPHVEWVDGQVVPMSPVTDKHSDLNVWLASLFRHLVEARDLGKVLCEPFQMKTGPDLPGRAPDIQFVAKPNLGRLKRLCTEGPADLVVEIISPGSRTTDSRTKFREYEQGGVPEYWLIDPQRKQAEFYQLGRDGIYRPANLGTDGVFQSKVLVGLWLRVEWLWQQPLPALLDVLKEWRLI